MIEHMKMMQMPNLGIWSMLLSGQMPPQDQFKSIALEWAIPEEKTKQVGGGEGLRTYCFFKKPLELFWFFSVAMEVSGYIPRKFQGQNPRPLEISHEFFLVSLGYSTLFLINFWKFCMLFLEYPWKFYILNHLPLSCLNFFQNKKESQITGWLFP